MRVIAKKRCRAMVEPPEKGERATLNPNLSTKLNLLFSDQALGRRVGYCWSRKASGAVSPFFEVLAGTALGPAFFPFQDSNGISLVRVKAELTDKHRNGPPRPGLQHETGNEHSGRWRIDGSDEDTRSFVEKLSGVKSVDKAIEIQTEFAKS